MRAAAAAAGGVLFIALALVPARGNAPASALDRLFASLRQAPDQAAAASIEQRIRILWFRSSSPTIDLLMHGALSAIAARDPAKARRLLHTIVALSPDYAEGWNLLGVLAAHAGEDDVAETDFDSALAIEPRQFDALSELARILSRRGQDAAALKTLERMRAIDPKAPGLAERLHDLTVRAKGQPI